MKRFLLSLIVLISISQAYAQSQLLISENFSGYSNGNLNGQGGAYPWTASSATYGSNFVQVANSSPLFYPGYTSGSQYINLTAKDDYTNSSAPYFHFPDDPTKGFISNTAIATNTASTFYLSFVVRIPSASGVAQTDDATPELSLLTSNGDNVANFYIAKTSGGVKFGIDKNGGPDGDYASGAGTTYNYNTTYLIVMRYDVVTGTNNDKLYLWVNPTITSEPATATASVSITTGSDGYTAGSSNKINKLELYQDNHSATASLDAIKVAYATGFSANPPVAWAALDPVGTPLPVKFGDINAYQKDKGIQVEWSVYSEINVVQYEIERSIDGVSFVSVGRVTAKSLDGKLEYKWFDDFPSSGNNYYRIKNVDIDGKSAYSAIVRVALGKTAAGLMLYPNPVQNNHLSFQATELQKGDYKIEIFNISGQQLYKKQFYHAGGSISQSIQLPSLLKTGIYNIQLTGTGFKLAKQFLVQ